jgi:mannose-6-phosphate isomerase-like protein (cupin superfamily)
LNFNFLIVSFPSGNYHCQYHEKNPNSVKLQPVNLRDKLSCFVDLWHPRIIGKLNGQYVKLAKLQGEFIWHHHEHEDELFLVLQGQLIILFPNYEVVVNPGEFIIVPKGIEHKPIASTEFHVLLLELVSTLNTGNIKNKLTHEQLQTI